LICYAVYYLSLLHLHSFPTRRSSDLFTVLTRNDVGEDDIHDAFHMAVRHTPSIIIFEDLDRLVRSPRLSLSYFLNALDGLKEMKDRKSTRLNSSHGSISYAVFCLKKK